MQVGHIGLREFWRLVLLDRLVSRRPNLTELQAGVERPLVMRFYNRMTCARVKGMARAWMLDGLFLGDRLARHNIGASKCPLCDADPETLEHRLWLCPRLDELRFIDPAHIAHWPRLVRFWGDLS